jgi:hypothetical protein
MAFSACSKKRMDTRFASSGLSFFAMAPSPSIPTALLCIELV